MEYCAPAHRDKMLITCIIRPLEVAEVSIWCDVPELLSLHDTSWERTG